MFRFQKKKCTAQATGTITKKKWNGDLWFLTVEYTVDGAVYTRKEQLTYRITKKYKLGPVPIGFRSEAALEKTQVGDTVRVLYDPNKPKRSYLPDNNGLHLA